MHLGCGILALVADEGPRAVVAHTFALGLLYFRSDDALAVVDAGVVFLHPEIDIGKDGLHSCLGDTPAVVFLLAIAFDGILLGFLQVGDNLAQHVVGVGSGLLVRGVVVDGGREDEGYVAESADEVEVAERTDGEGLRTQGEPLGLVEVGVAVEHFGGVVQQRVAEVDDIVVGSPAGDTVRGLEVALEDLYLLVTGAQAAHDVVGTELAPHKRQLHEIVVGHTAVARAEHGVHIILAGPVVLEHNLVERQDVQEIRTAE